MTNKRPSIFRDALQVSSSRISALRDDELDLLMANLLLEQARECGSPIGAVRVNTEAKAKDDGCDGWTARPARSDEWLGDTDTCWQFKAGSAGTPQRIRNEATKPIPRETLKSKGRFVLVASGSTNGKKGEEDRVAKLVEGASGAGVPTDQIAVIGSERLTTWCNRHPAIAARYAQRPAGLWTFDDLAKSEQHQATWQASDEIRKEIEVQRAAIDFAGGSVEHLHINGHPGVGKTRFALELCRNAPWRGSTIYVQQANDLRLLELIDSAAAEDDVHLVVIADEAQPEQLPPLRDSIGRSDGRIRLITIGHCPTPDPDRIPALLVRPLDRMMTREVVKGWYPSMPPEHVDFVVQFSGGYVRLARLAADAITRNGALDVRGLLDRAEIRVFLDRMLGAEERRSLHVVAALSRVGWTEDKQEEGRLVAHHLGLDWNDVRARVENFQRLYGIAPRGGRYCYISPTPLGTYLAVEAWNTYPDLMRTLPDILPSETARDAYYERLKSISSNVQAREYAREQLPFFFRTSDFTEPRAARQWSAFSAADPREAASRIFLALADSLVEERFQIADRARRDIVWTLVRLAWRRDSFGDSVKTLALLAEAENETWSNNSTGEFLGRFQIFLGGTATPYLERLDVLDELLKMNRLAITRLVIKALARAGEQSPVRTVDEPASDELPETEWRPTNSEEHLACLEGAIGKLTALAENAAPELVGDLIEACKSLSMMLRYAQVRPLVARLLQAVRKSHPETREDVRRIIADIIHHERKYWNELKDEDLAVLDALHGEFEDHSLAGRLRQQVGPPSWDRDGDADLRPIAVELLASRDTLTKEWAWLTSGDANDAWRLGEAIAELDDGRLAEFLPTLPNTGPDLRLISSYICSLRRRLGDAWYDAWVESQLKRSPVPARLVFDVAWRCGMTTTVASQVGQLLRADAIPSVVAGQLAYGNWGENLAPDSFEHVVRGLFEAGKKDTAIAVLHRRLQATHGDGGRWDQLALELVTSPQLIRGNAMTTYHWREVARFLTKTSAAEIASAIVREQGDRTSGTWFVEHSEAAKVLRECVENDAQAVWVAIRSALKDRRAATIFSIGFPKDILEHVPSHTILAWIQEDVDARAAMITRLINDDFSSDDTLAAQVLGAYGAREDVANTFFGEYISGGWSGPASIHWDQLAGAAETVASRTKLPSLRLWAANTARTLRKMAAQEREREAEEELE